MCKEDEIREPEFIESGAGFRVIIFKKILESADKSDGKEKSAGKKDREIIVVEYIEGNNYITTKIAMNLLELKETATKNLIRKMVKKEF